MKTIEYKTEGKVQVDCSNGNAPPVALTWMKDGTCVRLHTGKGGIELSKSQFLELSQYAERICDDLEPGMGSLPQPA